MGYVNWLTQPAAQPYLTDIYGASAQYGVEPGVLANQIGAESSFNPNAVSSSGAVGLGQFLPSTAANPGYGLSSFDPNDTSASIYNTAAYTQARGGYNADGLGAYSGGSYNQNTTNNILAGSNGDTGTAELINTNDPNSDSSLWNLFSDPSVTNKFSNIYQSQGMSKLDADKLAKGDSTSTSNFWQALLVRVLVGITGMIFITIGLAMLGFQQAETVVKNSGGAVLL